MVIFADGADRASIIELNKNPIVKGFTTNPTLLKKAGITNYKEFVIDILSKIDKPVSFEVISDDFVEMFDQALRLNSLGDNVYVKIPITNTKGESTMVLIEQLTRKKVKVNITAITTFKQVTDIIWALGRTPAYISIFAGRIADTGRDPLYDMIDIVNYVHENSEAEVIWASPREVFNIYQAESIDCDIITCTPDLIKKYEQLKGKDLTEYSRETVQMFFDDSIGSGLKL